MCPSLSPRAFALSQILTAWATSATAMPAFRPSYGNEQTTAIQLVKTQCYWKKYCAKWHPPMR